MKLSLEINKPVRKKFKTMDSNDKWIKIFDDLYAKMLNVVVSVLKECRSPDQRWFSVSEQYLEINIAHFNE